MDDPSTWIGRTLNGRYEIIDRLGHGGMATVYKANDPNLKRVVAIKMIHPHLATDAEFLRRFKEEATAVAQLRHPNIVQVYDYNADGQNNYIVFEFVPGETLQDRLSRLHKSDGQLSIDNAVKIASQMASALAYAHNRSMIHRDIKPANIMLDVHGDAILTDFGIVKIMGGTQHTATGATLGTAQYMSPEQIKGGQVDARCDLYSLGVALFEMVSGRRPFIAESAMTLMMMHINDPIPDLSQLRPDVPVELAIIIEKALAKEPDMRYQSAKAFLMALETMGDKSVAPVAAAAMATPPIATTVVEPKTEAAPKTAVSPTTTPPATASKKSPLPAIIGGIVLILLFLAAGLYFGGVFSGDDGDATADTDANATAIAETVSAALAQPTETAVSTNTAVPTTIPTQAATATSAATATTAPTIAPTVAPTAVPTTAAVAPTIAPAGKSVSITGISIDSNQQYIINYTTNGYTPNLSSDHIHFYFNTISEINAGQPGSGPWQIYGGPSPFSQYNVANKPTAATQLCAVVANPDHSIIVGSGSCFNIP